MSLLAQVEIADDFVAVVAVDGRECSGLGSSGGNATTSCSLTRSASASSNPRIAYLFEHWGRSFVGWGLGWIRAGTFVSLVGSLVVVLVDVLQ